MKKITLIVFCVICLASILVAFTACDVPSNVRGRYTGQSAIFGATSNTNWYVQKDTVYTTGAWLHYTYGGGSTYRISSNSSYATSIRDIAQDVTTVVGDFRLLRPQNQVKKVDIGYSDIYCTTRIRYNIDGNSISTETNVVEPMFGYSYKISGFSFLFVDGVECDKV